MSTDAHTPATENSEKFGLLQEWKERAEKAEAEQEAISEICKKSEEWRKRHWQGIQTLSKENGELRLLAAEMQDVLQGLLAWKDTHIDQSWWDAAEHLSKENTDINGLSFLKFQLHQAREESQAEVRQLRKLIADTMHESTLLQEGQSFTVSLSYAAWKRLAEEANKETEPCAK